MIDKIRNDLYGKVIIPSNIFLLNIVIWIYIFGLLFRRKNRVKAVSPGQPCYMYMMLAKRHYLTGIMSLLSFSYFITGLKVYLINDDLNEFLLFIVKRLIPNLEIVTEKTRKNVYEKISKYDNCRRFWDYDWAGKKFFIPLLHKQHGKVIMLDSDTLFVAEPKEIVDWLKDNTKLNLYLVDYLNFSRLSTIEAKAVLKRKLKVNKLNSGLLCFDLKRYWKNNSLKKIDSYINRIITINKDRMIYDHVNQPDFIYVVPLLEQTLHWLTFEAINAKDLNEERYYMFPAHKVQKRPIKSPVFIHFSGEDTRYSMYKYILGSLITLLQEFMAEKKSDDKPWYLRSRSFCFNCRHIKEENVSDLAVE